MMSLEQAGTLFVLMLVAQIPLLIAALINWLKSREVAKNASAAADAATDAVATATITAQKHAQTLERKIDENTQVTIDGTQAAKVSAKLAAVNAAEAKVTTDQMAAQLNGKLDLKVRDIVRETLEPFIAAFRIHAEQDEKNMLEIRTALGELRDRTARVAP